MDKKELLIRTASDLFAQKGYTETSIRDIGKAAKVNISLVYYYFKDKEEILYNIIHRSARDLIVILKEIQSNEPDPLECLRKMIIRQVLFSRETWQAAKLIVMDSYQLHGQRKNDCLRAKREIYDIYMQQLERLRESKIVDGLNLTVVNFVIFGMINWFCQWYKDEKPLTEEEIANQMTKILLSGILKPTP